MDGPMCHAAVFVRPLLVLARKAGQAPNEGRLQLRCMDAETLSLIRILWLGMDEAL